MSDQSVHQAHAWLKANESELLNSTQTMLRFPSTEEDAREGAPFGLPCREALDYALSICQGWGWRTKDLEGFAGYAEFGSGDKLIVVLGHLDVVPTGPGWKYPPFGAEVHDGYLYARGAEDDKGPTMASLYAMRAIDQTGVPAGVRYRIVFGCDEESGMTCVAKYAKEEEHPTYGLAPDSAWPCIHGEKGIADLFLTLEIPESEYQILECKGGQRRNIVVDSAEATMRVAATALPVVKEKIEKRWDKNIDVKWLDENTLVVVAHGKAAHGSTPFSGDSAATRLFRFLFETSPVSTEGFYNELMYVTHPSGVGLGIHGRDDVSHDLTSNLGVFHTDGSHLKLLVNVRYPTTWKGEHMRDLCAAFCKERSTLGMRLENFVDSPSLYFPLEHPMVKVLCDVYEKETGIRKMPGVMGGGTYARMLPNTISIGTGWEGDGKAHETDERIKVEHLYKMSRIYAHILLELAKI